MPSTKKLFHKLLHLLLTGRDYPMHHIKKPRTIALVLPSKLALFFWQLVHQSTGLWILAVVYPRRLEGCEITMRP